MISKDSIEHIIQDHEGENRETFAHYILPSLQDPLEVWLTRMKGGSYRRHFLTLFKESGGQSLLAIGEGKDGSIVKTFVPTRAGSYFDSKRKGFLLYRRRK